MSVGWGQWWQVCSHVPQAMPVCGSGCQHWVGFPPGELCCTLSDWLGSCPSSDNVPGVDDTNATTLTTWFPSSLDVMMTPETPVPAVLMPRCPCPHWRSPGGVSSDPSPHRWCRPSPHSLKFLGDMITPQPAKHCLHDPLEHLSLGLFTKKRDQGHPQVYHHQAELLVP